jgi:hypothetical protein
MGRELGYFDDDTEGFDRPDLNYCPDCKCYFASANCTICGKPCPEEMRAGNRKPVKVKRRRASSVSYVIPWYHSWWFILVMVFVFPLAALVLAASSQNKKWVRVTLIVISVIALVAPVIFNSIYGVIAMWLASNAGA